jgi:Domain of unknown function (DUF1870)
MNGSTLKALRQHLFFTQDEASTLIGGVTLRSWAFWEADKRTIPQDVIDTMRDLCAWRERAIAAFAGAIEDARDSLSMDVEFEAPRLVIYHSADDWATLPEREALLWKPHCSVVAHICARYRSVAVPFDAPGYALWLKGRTDSESLRGAWAAEVD